MCIGRLRLVKLLYLGLHFVILWKKSFATTYYNRVQFTFVTFFFVKSKGSLLHTYVDLTNFLLNYVFHVQNEKIWKLKMFCLKEMLTFLCIFCMSDFWKKIEIINLYFCWVVKPGWHCLRVHTSLGCYVWLTGTPLHRFLHQFR